MDAFYASVEQRDRPELRGVPLVVGGPPNSRGVVCTASYEARVFGVRSAMPCSQAARLCPQAIFVPPRFEAYKEVSQALHGIFRDYTDLIEPLSLDEAYLDVTENKRGIPQGRLVAEEIRGRIRRELRLTGSAGVSYCKFLAKVASDLRKPDGLTVVHPDRAPELIASLPVGRFFGVGPVTEKRLSESGLRTGADIREAGIVRMESLLGRQGRFLWGLSMGIDERPVQPDRPRRSVGTEDTFDRDERDPAVLADFLTGLAEKLSVRLERAGLRGRTVTLKVKYADFRQVTRSRTLEEAVSDSESLAHVARDLLRDTEAGEVAVRLLGITLSHFPGEERVPEGVWEQLELPLEDMVE